jgi:hypothetical protein
MRLWKGPTMSKPHSIRYIKQLMEWGFDKEFIARDAGINVESLMTRLRRAEERERNGNQGTESGTSSGQSDS